MQGCLCQVTEHLGACKYDNLKWPSDLSEGKKGFAAEVFSKFAETHGKSAGATPSGSNSVCLIAYFHLSSRCAYIRQ